MFSNQVQKKHLNNNDQQNEVCWSRMMHAKAFNPFSAGTDFRQYDCAVYKNPIPQYQVVHYSTEIVFLNVRI